MDPIEQFRDWHRAAGTTASLKHANAFCLSTVDDVGPKARMVDLKGIRKGEFVFTTSLASPKSIQIESNPNVALTFWWDHVGRQVRISGVASRLTDDEADELFGGRSRDARIASWAFRQSEPIPPGATKESLYSAAFSNFESEEVARPGDWSGYSVAPASIEFMEFEESRAHRRIRYHREQNGWSAIELQP